MGVEIEKKFLVNSIPDGLNGYPYHLIEQGYINVYPAIRVRREDDRYYMTYKGSPSGSVNDIGKVEYNMPLDEQSYDHIIAKADGNVISKIRYLIPLNDDAYSDEYLYNNKDIREMILNGDMKIELDIFKGPFEGRMLAEVEFPSEEAARNYRPADWFGQEVTGDPKYSNARMTQEEF